MCLINAHRRDHPEHRLYAAWLMGAAGGEEPIALSELVLSGFLRVVTHSRTFPTPTPPDLAWTFVEELTRRDNCRMLRPEANHWRIFRDLCRKSGARGNLIADAYHAALAIEHGCEWVTADADFARFPGLRWRHPLRP